MFRDIDTSNEIALLREDINRLQIHLSGFVQNHTIHPSKHSIVLYKIPRSHPDCKGTPTEKRTKIFQKNIDKSSQ